MKSSTDDAVPLPKIQSAKCQFSKSHVEEFELLLLCKMIWLYAFKSHQEVTRVDLHFLVGFA